MIAALGAAVFVPMLVEAARARRNERQQTARGGVEPEGDVYDLMRVAYPASFVAMIGEGWMRGVPAAPLFAAGAALFVAAKILKIWAIRSLGSFWTFRVIVVPGARLVSAGPYRYVRHPNYIAVFGELLGAALMTGAAVAGPLAVASFAFLIGRRIRVETRALAAAHCDEVAKSPKNHIPG